MIKLKSCWAVFFNKMHFFCWLLKRVWKPDYNCLLIILLLALIFLMKLLIIQKQPCSYSELSMDEFYKKARFSYMLTSYLVLLYISVKLTKSPWFHCIRLLHKDMFCLFSWKYFCKSKVLFLSLKFPETISRKQSALVS